MEQYLGWTGSILFAICSGPQAYKAYKDGHADGLSVPSLVLWTLGEIVTLAYVLIRKDWPLIANYVLNLVFAAVLWYYKLKPRAQPEKIVAYLNVGRNGMFFAHSSEEDALKYGTHSAGYKAQAVKVEGTVFKS